MQHLLIPPSHMLLGLGKIPLHTWSLIYSMFLILKFWEQVSLIVDWKEFLRQHIVHLSMFLPDSYFGRHIHRGSSVHRITTYPRTGCQIVASVIGLCAKTFSTLTQSINVFGCILLLYSGITTLMPRSLLTFWGTWSCWFRECHLLMEVVQHVVDWKFENVDGYVDFRNLRLSTIIVVHSIGLEIGKLSIRSSEQLLNLRTTCNPIPNFIDICC